MVELWVVDESGGGPGSYGFLFAHHNPPIHITGRRFGNEEECRAECRRRSPDSSLNPFCLLDLQGSGPRAMALANELLARLPLSCPLLLVNDADVSSELLLDATRAGILVVRKPIDPDTLLHWIHLAMQRLESNQECFRAKQKLQDVLESTRVGTWEWNVVTGQTLFNERWAEILGYKLEELEPISIKTWMDLAHPEDLELSNELLQKHFSGELGYYDAECRMRHKEGHWLWVHDRGRVVEWDRDRQPLRMAGTHIEISSRKQLEAMILEQSEERHRMLFENAVQGIVYHAPDGKIFAANPAAERILGLTFEQMSQQASADPRWHPVREDGSPFPGEAHPASLSLRTGAPVHDVVMGVFNPKTNSHAWININALPVFDPDRKELQYVIVSFEEITARRLHEEQLRQTFRLQAAGALSAAITHEIAQPLNALSVTASLLKVHLREDALPDADLLRKQGMRIVREVERIASVMSQMRRLGSGNTATQVSTDVGQVVARAHALTHAHIADHGATLSVLLPEPCPQVLTVPEDLEMILINLITNSLHAMEGLPIDGKRVWVGGSIAPDFLELTVRDGGPGFGPDPQRALEPFYTTRPPAQGLGLGLAIVQAVVQAWGGKIALGNHPDGGACVTLHIPYAKDLPS